MPSGWRCHAGRANGHIRLGDAARDPGHRRARRGGTSRSCSLARPPFRTSRCADAIQHDLNGAIDVRPEDLDAVRPQPIYRGGRGMAVRVPLADRDEPDPGPDRLEEGGRGRGPAAMMGDLQDLRRRQAPAQQHRVDRFLDVAGQHEALTSERSEEDDRHVVDGSPAVGRLARHGASVGPQDAEGDPVEGEPVAR
jgi:hypothetical protein